MRQQPALDAIRQLSEATPVAEVRESRLPIFDSTLCQCVDTERVRVGKDTLAILQDSASTVWLEWKKSRME